jgi:hypothetical protein
MLNLALTIAAITVGVYFTTILGILVYYIIKLYHLKHPKTGYISIEEVTKLVEDAMFWDLVAKIASDKKATCDGETFNDTGYVTILQPCENNNCPCHESREDCCNTGVEIDGKRYCKILVDINKLCGLPSVKEKPDVSKLLTDEECKLLAKSIVEYMEAADEK